MTRTIQLINQRKSSYCIHLEDVVNIWKFDLLFFLIYLHFFFAFVPNIIIVSVLQPYLQ